MQRFGNLQTLQSEHLRHHLPHAARRRLVIVFQKARQLFQPLYAFLSALHLSSRAHQIAHLAVLLPRRLLQDVPHLVIAAALHRLLGPKHLLDGAAQALAP